MWLGVELPDATQGWLPLTPVAATNRFQDGVGNFELFASASDDSGTIGSFTYAELVGSVFAVQLDLPESIAPSDDDKSHLGGCWQQDRTNERGLQFYWPADADL